MINLLLFDGLKPDFRKKVSQILRRCFNLSKGKYNIDKMMIKYRTNNIMTTYNIQLSAKLLLVIYLLSRRLKQ